MSGSGCPSTALTGDGPAQAAGPEHPGRAGAGRPPIPAPIRTGLPRSPEQVQHLPPGHPGQHVLVQRRRTPDTVRVLPEQVAARGLGHRAVGREVRERTRRPRPRRPAEPGAVEPTCAARTEPAARRRAARCRSPAVDRAAADRTAIVQAAVPWAAPDAQSRSAPPRRVVRGAAPGRPGRPAGPAPYSSRHGPVQPGQVAASRTMLPVLGPGSTRTRRPRAARRSGGPGSSASIGSSSAARGATSGAALCRHSYHSRIGTLSTVMPPPTPSSTLAPPVDLEGADDHAQLGPGRRA